MKLSAAAENLLERLWIEAFEEGKSSVALNELKISMDHPALLELTGQGLIRVDDSTVRLLPGGHREGQLVVRKHRLSERLMMDIFDLKGTHADDKACEFEHLLNEGVDSKICDLLNHPDRCPHGKAIPPGRCCLKARREGRPGVICLPKLKPGQSGEIAYLATKDPQKMQKLMSMGVLPGSRIRLSQNFPSYIFRLGSSDFAVDEQLAREIFVRLDDKA